MTRDASFAAHGCETVHSIEEGRALAAGGELFVIGGAALYAEFMPLADRLFITHIDADVAGDTLFPRIEAREWRLVEEAPGAVDPRNPLPHRFAVYERIAS
jgi:dihydrofolate reductase